MDKINTLNTNLLTLNNENILLDKLLENNKINLLLFYHTNCLGCTGRAIPFGYEIWRENKEKVNLVVVHVDFSNKNLEKEEIYEIFHDKKPPFEIYRDKNAAVYEMLACEGTPHWIVLSKDGEVQNSIFGSQENAQMRLRYLVME